MVSFRCYINNSYLEDGEIKQVDCFQELVQEVVDKADSLGAEKVNVVNIIEPEDKLKEGVRVEVVLPDDKTADFSSYLINYFSEYSWQFERRDFYYEFDGNEVHIHVESK